MFRYHPAAKYLLPTLAASLAFTAPLAAQRNNGTGTRDGAAISGEDRVRVTAIDDAEVVLVDAA